jgi:hypothetical protein
MPILRDLINNMKTDNIVEQMRILTEQIFEEESKEMKNINYRPQGANIFLCLEVPGSTINEIGFLALERETEDLWIASFWTLPKIALKDVKPASRKKKIHQITDHRPEKILTSYAKLFKFYNGE